MLKRHKIGKGLEILVNNKYFLNLEALSIPALANIGLNRKKEEGNIIGWWM